MKRADYYDGQFDLPDGAVDLETLQAVPAKRGVYVLLTASGEPVTAVIAADMRNSLIGRLHADRCEGPTKRADLSQVSAQVRWRLAASRFESDMVYLDIVRRLWPRDFAAKLPRRRAWFVHFADLDGIPRLLTVSALDSVGSGAACLGPFPTRKTADRYIELLTDIFDLCRYNAVIRQAPQGKPCAYAQMDRCLAPCSGAMPMADYRSLIARAMAFACGDRRVWTDELYAAMKARAAEARFEQAAAFKGRLESIAELDTPRLRGARRADSLRYVIVQRGKGIGKIRLFASCGGAVCDSVEITWPGEGENIKEILSGFRHKMSSLMPFDPHGLAIIVQYLFSTQEHAGWVLPSDTLTDAELMTHLDKNAAWLTRRKAPEDGEESGDTEVGENSKDAGGER